jgi:hypothetical protein
VEKNCKISSKTVLTYSTQPDVQNGVKKPGSQIARKSGLSKRVILLINRESFLPDLVWLHWRGHDVRILYYKIRQSVSDPATQKQGLVHKRDYLKVFNYKKMAAKSGGMREVAMSRSRVRDSQLFIFILQSVYIQKWGFWVHIRQ